MAMKNDSGVMTFECAGALAYARAVVLDDDGKITYAAAEDEALGVTVAAGTTGEHIAIDLRNKPGTVKIELASAVVLDTTALAVDPRGAPLYTAANGKVAATGTAIRFVTFTSGTTGDIIEALFVH